MFGGLIFIILCLLGVAFVEKTKVGDRLITSLAKKLNIDFGE
jgi:hypothetical protein